MMTFNDESPTTAMCLSTRSPLPPRGQTSAELLIILAASIVLLAFLMNFTIQQVQTVSKQHDLQTAQHSVDELIAQINQTYAQGNGATQKITLTWPRGIDANNTYLSGKTIVLRVYESDIVGSADIPISGTIPTTPGKFTTYITANSNSATIGTLSLSSSTSSVYIPMVRDTNQTTHFTITNNSSEAADAGVSIGWDSTYVDLNIGPSSFTLPAFGSQVIDVNVRAGSSAIGNYAHYLQIKALFPNSEEFLTFPVNVEVFSGTGALLAAAPNILHFDTVGSDTNSLVLQLCNSGSQTIKTLSFIPSGGDAGDWVSSIPSFDLAANSCSDVNVTVTTPKTTPQTYTGSLAITDYSGANSLVIPIQVDVLGYNTAFYWDWNSTIATHTIVHSFEIGNRGSAPIAINAMKVSKWWTCDSNQSKLSSIKLGGTTIYSGSADDNAWVDVTDFNVPQTTAYGGVQNTLTFSGSVSDENEQFQVDVNLSDGSVYNSSVFGNGCTDDTTPPGTVSNMVATPGPLPRQITYTFTAPGDDGFTGVATDMNFRYAYSAITNDANFSSATAYSPSWTPPVGGTSTSFTFLAPVLGNVVYGAAKFRDEVPNTSALSNSPGQKPWNRYRNSLSQLNTTNLYQLPPSNDVNQFIFNAFQGTTTSNRIAFRLYDDSNQNNSIVIDLNTDRTSVQRVRVWYPSTVQGSPCMDDVNHLGTAQLDRSPRTSTANGISFLDASTFFNYTYNGGTINMGTYNHGCILALTGYTDINMSFDRP